MTDFLDKWAASSKAHRKLVKKERKKLLKKELGMKDIIENEPTYTRQEVCNILCEGCEHQIASVREASYWFHFINEVKVPCRATLFQQFNCWKKLTHC